MFTTIAEIRAYTRTQRAQSRTIALVPTMGALHDGHLALVRRAAEEADDVVVSIFVNPTQFDRPDDLVAYPRDLSADVRRLAELDSSAPLAIFAPDTTQMYPREPATQVQVASLTQRLCGASRPGHFDGVATVVTKLLTIVAPDIAVFGRKDRQQLAVVERLVEDLNIDVRIVGVTTVRDGDGVASSSRNARLTAAQRPVARGLPQALAGGLAMVRSARASQGCVDPVKVAATMRQLMEQCDGLRVDYAEAVDPATMQPPQGPVDGTARLVLAVAGFVGDVRLIDNIEAGVPGDEAALLGALAATVIQEHAHDG